MFELNSSYSNVQKTKTKTASRSCFWLPKIRILDETIEERCARAVSRKTPIYFILEIKWKSITSTLVLLHWSLTLECSSGLVGLYNVTSNCIRSIYNCEVYLGEAIHHFPPLLSERLCNHKASQCESHRFFLERSRNSLKYLTIWWTFLRISMKKKTNKKRYLGAVHKWRHHFWRVYTPPSTELCNISFLSGWWNIAQGGDPL